MGKVLADFVLYGAFADLPADNTAGTTGRLYCTSDTHEVYRDNGATWDKVAQITSASLPTLGYIGYRIYDDTLGANGEWDIQEGDLLSGAGAFEDYDYLDILATNLRSTQAATGDGVRLFFGTAGGALDTTAANYSAQALNATGTTVSTTRSDTNDVGSCPGSSSPANYVGVLRMTVYNPAAGNNHMAEGKTLYRRDASNQDVRHFSLQWENTGAIDRIGLRVDGYATDHFAAGARLMIVGYKS